MSKFEPAFKIMIEHEGGYTNDPEDIGGKTRFGVSKRSHPDVDIEHLTLEHAKQIYKKEYWDSIRLDEINDQTIANKVFDIGVNIGTRRIIGLLQSAINMAQSVIRLVVDGRMGDKTIAACNDCHPQVLMSFLKPIIINYYRSLDRPKYIKGWINRASS
jgi:lysozyme family protein